MTQPKNGLLAKHLISAWQSGIPLTAAEAAALAPGDEATAYAVQQQVADALGWFPEGRARAWKIASKPRVAAPIPNTFIMTSPAEFNPIHSHTVIGIEVELALLLVQDLPADCSPDVATAAIGQVLAAIELFDVRAENWQTLPANFLLADSQMHGRLVLGSGIDGPWQADFGNAQVDLFVDGRSLQSGRCCHPLGSPTAILPWLAGHVSRYSDGLKAGDIVASGAWNSLYFTRPGEHLTACFEGIGEVQLTIQNIENGNLPHKL